MQPPDDTNSPRRARERHSVSSPASENNLPKVIDDCHELLKWLIPLLDQFPRSRRFTLGERLETGLLDVLEECVDAATPA